MQYLQALRRFFPRVRIPPSPPHREALSFPVFLVLSRLSGLSRSFLIVPARERFYRVISLKTLTAMLTNSTICEAIKPRSFFYSHINKKSALWQV